MNPLDRSEAGDSHDDISASSTPSLLAELQWLIDHPSQTSESAGYISPSGDWLHGIGTVDDSIHRLGSPPAGRSTTELTLPTPLSIGQYELLSIIGSGGFGIVFRAHDRNLDRTVAVKILRPELSPSTEQCQRFLREAKAAARLEHPGIVPVHRLGTDEIGRPYFAMRLVQGESVGSAIKKLYSSKLVHPYSGEWSLQLRKLLGRFVSVCQTIEYAHSRGVVHRDIKPDNIMLGEYGETLVVDWGMAKLVAGEERPEPHPDASQAPPVDDASIYTRAGAVLGTPAFMSPERATGSSCGASPASDIYSLGATLFAILSGRSPPAYAQGTNQATQPPEQQRGQRPFDKRMPKALVAICERAMALRPDDRYSSAGNLAEDIERFLADLPVHARQETFVERTAREARRHWVWLQASCVIAVCIVVGSGIAATVIAHQRHQAHLRGLIQAVRSADLKSLPRLIDDLDASRNELHPLLRQAASFPELTDGERLNFELLLMRERESSLDRLEKQFADADPAELLVICELLAGRRQELASRMWRRLDIAQDDGAPLLRAACVLAQSAPDDPRWGSISDRVADALVRQNPLLAIEWLEAFRPVGTQLRSALAERCAQERTEPAISNAAQFLAQYARGNMDLVVSRLLDAEPTQLEPLVSAVAASSKNAKPRLYAVLRTTELPELPQRFAEDPISDDPLSRLMVLRARQGRAALALLAIGESDVWSHLDVSPDPTVRNWVAQFAAQAGLRADIWLNAWSKQSDVGRRRLILHALARYPLNRLPIVERDRFVRELQDRFRHEPDAGFHAAIRLVLSSWGHGQWLREVERELASSEPAAGQDWYVNQHGQTFSIIAGPRDGLIGAKGDEWLVQPHEVPARARMGRTAAICQTEVTVEQIMALLGSHTSDSNHFSKQPTCPAVAVHWLDAARYCRLLSEREGIAEDQMCFPPLAEIQVGMQLPADYLDRTGYRLPTEIEWEFAARAGTLTRGYFGVDSRLAGGASWNLLNSGAVSHPVANLLPNEWGLFDMLGNVCEWTVGVMGLNDAPEPGHAVHSDEIANFTISDDIGRMLRGADFSQMPILMRSAGRLTSALAPQAPNVGFRVVRTLPRATSKWQVVEDWTSPPGTVVFQVIGPAVPFEARGLPEGLTIHPQAAWTPATIEIRADDGLIRPFSVQLVRLDTAEAVELRGVAGQVPWERTFYHARGKNGEMAAPQGDWQTSTSYSPIARNHGIMQHNWGLGSPSGRVPRDHFALLAKANPVLPNGFYEFFLRFDEGAVVKLNGTAFLTPMAYSQPVSVSSWAQLSAVKQQLEANYLHKQGPAELRFELRRIDSVVPFHAVRGKPLKPDAWPPLAVQFDGEDLPIVATSESIPKSMRMNMLHFGRYWRGARQLRVEANEPGQWVEWSFDVPQTCEYDIAGELTKSNDGGIVDIAIDGERLAFGCDLFALRYMGTGRLDWGRKLLTAGKHRLRIRVNGTNDKSIGVRYAWGLDYIELIPVAESWSVWNRARSKSR